MEKLEPKSWSELEQNPKIRLQLVAEECKLIENLRHDTAQIEKRDLLKINAIKQKQDKEKSVRKINPCYCGGQIPYKECPFRKKD